jgi:hypothetical protein
VADIRSLDTQLKANVGAIADLVDATGSTITETVGVGPIMASRLISRTGRASRYRRLTRRLRIRRPPRRLLRPRPHTTRLRQPPPAAALQPPTTARLLHLGHDQHLTQPRLQSVLRPQTSPRQATHPSRTGPPPRRVNVLWAMLRDHRPYHHHHTRDSSPLDNLIENQLPSSTHTGHARKPIPLLCQWGRHERHRDFLVAERAPGAEDMLEAWA